MSHFQKYFTLAEANALLPWIHSIFSRIHQILAVMHAVDEQAAISEELGLKKVNGHGNGNGKSHGMAHLIKPPMLDEDTNITIELPLEQPIGNLTRKERLILINSLLQTILNEGIVVQDVQRGLIDFPCRRQGRDILLCYELSDGPRIDWWHDLQSGFAGRQPIDDIIDELSREEDEES